MPPPIQEAGHGEPLKQMLALKPRIELGLASGAAVVEDRKDTGLPLGHFYLAATTMISTL